MKVQERRSRKGEQSAKVQSEAGGETWWRRVSGRKGGQGSGWQSPEDTGSHRSFWSRVTMGRSEYLEDLSGHPEDEGDPEEENEPTCFG